MKNDYGMKMNIFTIANAWLYKSEMTNMYAVCLLWETQKVLWNQNKIYVAECPVLLWKYDWKYRKKRKTNEKKLNHRQQQKQNIYHCGLDLQNSFFLLFC